MRCRGSGNRKTRQILFQNVDAEGAAVYASVGQLRNVSVFRFTNCKNQAVAASNVEFKDDFTTLLNLMSRLGSSDQENVKYNNEVNREIIFTAANWAGAEG
jgi:hypothetical protein